MATDISSIITRAAQVKNETVENANTASRVGGVLLDLAAFAAQGIFADEIAFEADASGVSVRLRYHNAQGQPYERRAYIPALNTATGTAGVLTATQYEAMKALGAVREVGVFTGTATAWAACATAEVAGNSAYRVLKYQIGTVHYYIEQSVRDNFCTQYLYEGQQRFIRTIRFASNDRTQVQNVGAWAKTGAQSISYTPSTRELFIKDFNGEYIGTKATLPVASTSTPGLLSAADKKKLDACVTSPATTSAAGLMTAADKKKLDACVTTDANLSKAGLMTPAQVADLDNALLRDEVGYFSDIETFDEGTNAVWEIQSTTSTAGKVVYCNRIAGSAGSSLAKGAFAYKVGTKYYYAAPGAFARPMPRRGCIAINLSDGCAYVLDSDGELQKFVPVCTTSLPGLMPTSAYQKLNTLTQQANNIHLIDLGTFDTMLAAENAAAAQAVCSNPLWRHIFYKVGGNSFHLTQQVENDYCLQTIYMGRAVRQRYIRFADSTRNSVAEVQSWQDALVRNLKYTASSQTLQLQSPWNDNIGAAATIPTVTDRYNGLAPREWFSRFTSIEARLAALEGKATAAATADTADTTAAEEAGGEA